MWFDVGRIIIALYDISSVDNCETSIIAHRQIIVLAIDWYILACDKGPG